MHMFKRHILAASLLLLGAGLAVAQTPPAQPPAAAAPAAPTFTESHLAAARDVVVGSGLSRGFDGMAAQIGDQLRASVSRTRPELIKDMEEVLRLTVTEFSSRTEPLVVAASRLFAARMTEAELKEVGAFFKTASGQKYVNTQGPLVNELYVEMQVFSQTLGNLMMDRVREEMRKKGHQL